MLTSLLPGSKAKLNSTRMTSMNANDAFTASRVRHSARRSFAAIVKTWRRNTGQSSPPLVFPIGPVQPACVVDHLLPPLPRIDDLSALDHRDVRRGFQSLAKLVRGHDDRPSALVHVVE